MNEHVDVLSTEATDNVAYNEESPQTTESEEWRVIEDFPGYEVSSLGRVRNSRTSLVLRQNMGSSPYLCVALYRKENGKSVMFRPLVHRLVTKAFIPNPDNKKCVDHSNTISTDNRACNLTWCTTVENHHNPLTYARQVASKRERAKSPIWRAKVSKAHNARKKMIRCIETGLVYPSLHEASRVLNRCRASIKQSCIRTEQDSEDLFPFGSVYKGKLVLHFEYYTDKSIDELSD